MDQLKMVTSFKFIYVSVKNQHLLISDGVCNESDGTDCPRNK